MDTPDSMAAALIDRILTGAADLTLATLRADGSPHASTVNFAHSRWQLYTAISLDSGKAHDINHDHRVALTVNLPYSDWHDIQGLAIDGEAAFVTDPQELARVAALLRSKLPAFDTIIERPHVLPWPGMLFLRITPHTVSLLDYTRGYGHTERYRIDPEQSGGAA